MKIEDIIDDVVLLLISDTEPFQDLGITQKRLYTRVKGLDEYGLWIEHPGLKVPKIPSPEEVKASKIPKKPQFRTVSAAVLIPWGFIVSVVAFPGVEGFDFPDPFELKIGFNVE